MKKLIIISTVVVILAGVGGWYFFFYRTAAPTPTPATTQTGTPFGVAPGDVTPSGAAAVNTTPFSTTGNTSAAPTAALFKISSDPVAGAIIFLRGKDEIIRYVDRATGHIYEADPHTFVKTQIVNNTSPKIYDALWKADGSTVLVRTLRDGSDTTVNTSLTLTPPKATSSDALYTIKAVELRGDVRSIAASATSLAFVLGDTGAVVSSDFTGGKLQTLYASDFTQWQLMWQGSNLVLTTNASASAEGFSYLLKSGGLTKLLGPLTALTTLINSDGSRIAYSYIDNGNMLFGIKDLKNKNMDNIVPSTLAEKCVWSQKQKSTLFCATPTNGISASEPDSWYQGLTHFSDNLWKFDTTNGTASLLAEPKKKFGTDIDVIKPMLSPNEDFLIFQNKTDLSLWALKLL